MTHPAKLPTKSDIAVLPRWAKVAFAGRCARRVLPLFKHNFAKATHKQVVAVCHAIEVAERAAALGKVDATEASSARAAAAAANAYSEYAADADAYVDAYAAADAAYAAYAAADAADTAADAGDAGARAVADADAARAAADAARAARAANAARGADALPCIINDFKIILDAARRGGWTDDTPVPPWAFGPMWPTGVPEGWPAADQDERIVVTVAAPPNATAQQIADIRTRVYTEVNKLFIANGGPGLTHDLIRRMVTVNIPVPGGG